jgi:hypothetical protein
MKIDVNYKLDVALIKNYLVFNYENFGLTKFELKNFILN